MRFSNYVDIIDTLHATAPTVNYDTKYKMIRTANLKDGKLDTKSMKSATEETYNKWTRRGTLRLNDIVLSREAPIGRVGIIENADVKYFLGQRMLRLRSVSDHLDQNYLYYKLQSKSFQNLLSMFNDSGSVVSNLRIPVLKNLDINFPSLECQQKVVNIIKPFDKQITFNNQINDNLANRYHLKYLINKLFLIAFSLLFSLLFWNIFLNMGLIVMLKSLMLSSLIFGIKRFPICFG